MAKRDPNKTARNRIISDIKKQLRDLLPIVLKKTGIQSEASLNAQIGHRTDKYFDLKNEIINSQDQFASKWLQGLKTSALEYGVSSDVWFWGLLKNNGELRNYVILFLKRSYLTHFDELSKNRPTVEAAELWIGQQNANYGLLVTPRFKNGIWENDKSEIRAFTKPYWSIGHVMETGLVIPGQDKKFEFYDIDQYLLFFQETIVRNSGSTYEYQIAGYYYEFVKSCPSPETVPLLIPEFRYAGIAAKHLYRLDFLIINPYTLNKVGFELSPWSTHGYLRKIKGLTQKEINQMAADNFAKEMRKHRAYFKKHDIYCLIYTDHELKNTELLFEEDFIQYLKPEKPPVQLEFQIINELF